MIRPKQMKYRGKRYWYYGDFPTFGLALGVAKKWKRKNACKYQIIEVEWGKKKVYELWLNKYIRLS